MVIQFSCPACRQPIEVDDQWADHQVGCPLCQKVVTAPLRSTLLEDQIAAPILARRASGQGGVYSPATRKLAVVGLVCSLLSLFCSLAAGIFIQAFIFQRFGPDVPVQQLLPELKKEMIEKGVPPQLMLGTVAMCFGLLFWLAGLVLSVLSAARGDRRIALAGIGFSMVLPVLFCLPLLFAS